MRLSDRASDSRAIASGWIQDLRYAARSLRRSPAVALPAIAILALAIAATTTALSIADHVLLRPLPFRDADRLVTMLERGDRGELRTPSAPTVNDWARDPGAQAAFDGITFVRGDAVALRHGDAVEHVAAAFVAPEFFRLLGARPLLGRTLIDDDHRDGAAAVAVLSFEMWHDVLGADSSIVGRRVAIDSVPTTIVGVLPAGARYPDFASVWQPVSHYRHRDVLAQRGLHVDSRTIARLRPGVDSARAVLLMRGVSARLAAAYPADQAHWTAGLFPLRTDVIGNVRSTFTLLGAAAVAVLLLACANVANLLLARLAARNRELAVRNALGASRWRIARQLFAESATLVAVSGAIGCGLTALALGAARGLPPNRLPRADELRLDGRVLVIALIASALAVLACGLWPAVRATRVSAPEVLRAAGHGGMASRGESRLRRTLVVVQFALALTLLVGAGLLLQSFRRAASVDVGFDPRGLLTVRIDPPNGAYPSAADAAALYARLIAAVRAVPGVRGAAFINHAPFGGASILTPVQVDGAATNDTASRQIFYRTISNEYFSTIGATITAGRAFDAADMRSPGGAFIVNRAMAAQYWPGQTAVGQRVTVRRSSQARADFGEPLTGVVVGVVADVHQVRQDVAPEPEIYVPYTLETWPWGNLVVRARDGARAIPALRRAIAGIDARLIENGAAGDRRFTSLETAIGAQLAPRRFSMALIAGFAVCALVLAAIGLYGVMAYAVVQRRREIAVRKALGATDRAVGAMLMRESLLVTGAGVVLGVLGAWMGARLIRGLLFETGVADPVAYVATIGLLTTTALAATYVPARAAMRMSIRDAL